MSHDAVPHGQHFSQDTAALVSPTAMGSASLAVPLEEQGAGDILAPYPWCVSLELGEVIVIGALRYRAFFGFRYRGVS